MNVVRVDALGFGEVCCAPAEVVFDGAPEGDGVGEVDQPAAVGGNVAWVFGSDASHHCASVDRIGDLPMGTQAVRKNAPPSLRNSLS